MRNIILLFCKVLLICAICSTSSLNAQNLQPSKNVPLIESKSNGHSSYYVILFTGNGGWRPLVQYITRYLNSNNISVLAINTRNYLWSGKEPAQIACDLENLIERYNIKWEQKEVVLIGYSMGAEVLPFAVNCMKDEYLAGLHDMILIGPWQMATFDVRLMDYFIEVNRGKDIYQETLKMKLKTVYIICDDNKFSLCHNDLDGVISHDFLGGGHHFGKEYFTLSKLIGKRLNLE
jgi:type IV secretory pathway VirJ component